jgi:biotin carboxyl carrier protein
MEFDFLVRGKAHRVSLESRGGNRIATVDGREIPVDTQRVSGDTVALLIGGKMHLVHLVQGESRILAAIGGSRFTLEEPDTRRASGGPREEMNTPAGGTVKAPMPGQVIKINVTPGDNVEAGQGLVVVEAMKMEHEMRSPTKAIVEQVYVVVGQQVDAFQPLVELRPS